MRACDRVCGSGGSSRQLGGIGKQGGAGGMRGSATSVKLLLERCTMVYPECRGCVDVVCGTPLPGLCDCVSAVGLPPPTPPPRTHIYTYTRTHPTRTCWLCSFCCTGVVCVHLHAACCCRINHIMLLWTAGVHADNLATECMLHSYVMGVEDATGGQLHSIQLCPSPIPSPRRSKHTPATRTRVSVKRTQCRSTPLIH